MYLYKENMKIQMQIQMRLKKFMHCTHLLGADGVGTLCNGARAQLRENIICRSNVAK